ncbi:MAG: glycosyltransferase involved in cell wall biosynthesis [Myxococcota bacterium]
MSDRIRVLLQAPLPPPTGGIATWTYNVVHSELAQEFDIRLVDMSYGTRAGGDKASLLRKVRKGAHGLFGVADALLQHRPQVLHVCSTGHPRPLLRDAPGLRMARASGVATAVHIHGDAARLTARPGLSKRILRKVDSVITLGAGSRASAESIGLTNVAVLPNSIAARPLPDRPPLSARRIRLLFLGNIQRAKGIVDLLDALKHTPNLDLFIVGRWMNDRDGSSCEQDVRNRIADPDLAQRVHLIGPVATEEVWEYYAKSDVLVLPSYTEGFPMTLLESMVSGMPSVVTPVGAMPEVVRHGHNGWVVPVGKPEALAETLNALTAETVGTTGANANTLVREVYTHAAVHRQLAQLWRSLADEAR